MIDKYVVFDVIIALIFILFVFWISVDLKSAPLTIFFIVYGFNNMMKDIK